MTANIHHIYGAGIADDIFEITLAWGKTVIWNVTKLNAAAKAGAFGAVRYARTSELPPAAWETWDATDRAQVDAIKRIPEVLDLPAIAIESPNPEFFILCFADGQHRITARQELRMDEIAFYVVPWTMQARYRVTGFDELKKDLKGENR